MGTTSRGYPYPEVTDDVRPHEDIQALAASVNTDVGTLEGKHCGRIVQNALQNLNDNTVNMIIFAGADDFDYGSAHNPASNNTRVTPTKAGIYRFVGTVFFSDLASGVSFDVNFRKNGTTAIAPGGRLIGSAQVTSVACQCLQAMNGSTDYMELAARQDSAGADSTQVSSQFTSVMEWEWIRPL